MRALTQRPLAFALAAAALYATLLLLALASVRFDPSVFVIAGDRYVDTARLDVPIAVALGSQGYDGQFFYRFALHPLSIDPTAGGITLDDPPKRMERVVYPLLAWAVSLGQARLAAAALLAVNLAGIAALAAVAAWLTRRRGLAWWFPIAVMAWPGFLGTLLHDTAEIAAASLLLGAVTCYLSDRLRAFCILATLAALTRETVLPVLFGLAAVEAYRAASASRPVRRVVACAVPLLAFGAWRQVLSVLWQRSPQSLAVSSDLGWPLLGVARVILANLTGTQVWDADPVRDVASRAFVLVTACLLIGFCVVVACQIPGLTRRLPGLALGWLLTAALMSLLTEGGPWIDPHAYFRAFTECWVVGCVLLASAPLGRTVSRWLRLGAGAGMVAVPVYWLWCFGVFP